MRASSTTNRFSTHPVPVSGTGTFSCHRTAPQRRTGENRSQICMNQNCTTCAGLTQVFSFPAPPLRSPERGFFSFLRVASGAAPGNIEATLVRRCSAAPENTTTTQNLLHPAPIPGRDILFPSKHTGTDIHRHPSCIRISRQNRFYPSHISLVQVRAGWCVWSRAGEKRKKIRGGYHHEQKYYAPAGNRRYDYGRRHQV